MFCNVGPPLSTASVVCRCFKPLDEDDFGGGDTMGVVDEVNEVSGSASTIIISSCSSASSRSNVGCDRRQTVVSLVGLTSPADELAFVVDLGKAAASRAVLFLPMEG